MRIAFVLIATIKIFNDTTAKPCHALTIAMYSRKSRAITIFVPNESPDVCENFVTEKCINIERNGISGISELVEFKE